MKDCDCLGLVERSSLPLERLKDKVCDKHKAKFWEWIGEHPDI